MDKICHKCKRKFPANSKYFYKNKLTPDGFKASCKECHGGNFDVKEKTPDGFTKCTQCGLPDPEFKECWSLKNLQPLLKEDNLQNQIIGTPNSS